MAFDSIQLMGSLVDIRFTRHIQWKTRTKSPVFWKTKDSADMGLAFIDARVPNQLIRIKLAAQPEDEPVDQSAFPECPILRNNLTWINLHFGPIPKKEFLERNDV